MTRIFLDANVILDTYDESRRYHRYSVLAYGYILEKDIMLFTSCDIITTLYYVNKKNETKEETLRKIEQTNITLKVIEFSNKEVARTCTLMKEDPNYRDLEDTMQYILAKKEGCDLIISNDENFYAADIEVIGSEAFCRRVEVV